eukprot:3273337-Ditylum_brightwellii.AAC.1
MDSLSLQRSVRRRTPPSFLPWNRQGAPHDKLDPLSRPQASVSFFVGQCWKEVLHLGSCGD